MTSRATWWLCLGVLRNGWISVVVCGVMTPIRFKNARLQGLAPIPSSNLRHVVTRYVVEYARLQGRAPFLPPLRFSKN